ncbi:hypothetical protein DSM112329_00459 [Paraconexibacter sp. AEG42_29]|uniref:CAAX prenyl protease 2/Lysostaphin resistance protein A-like domain-containing protein n=2 Tax=Paraconexibacter sp. AEG42_29 TaxID=2997339 RepID=A0AAU7APZ5_9ACTN
MVIVLRVSTLVAWPAAAVCVLATARVPAWWRAWAGRTLTRAAHQRAHAWLLTETRSGRAAADVPVAVPVLGVHVQRRSLLVRVLLLAPLALARWVIGTFAVLAAFAVWMCRVFAVRHPRWLRRLQWRLQALCGDIDAYVLLLVPRRPRLPEVDPRLAPGGVALQDHPPLPPWSRRMGRLSIVLDAVAGVVVVGGVAGLAVALGADLDDDQVVVLGLDLLIQTLAPAMGFLLAASQAPLTVAQLGLHVLRPLRSAALAFGLIASYAVLLLSFALLATPFAAEAAAEGGGIIPDDSGLAWTIVFIGLATVIAPVFEEAFYRGVMFQALRARRGTWTAAVVSSIAFAAAHLEFAPVALINRALIGIGLCYLFARTGRLLPGMFAHSINNALVVPLTIGWTWQVPIVVVVSLVLVWALAWLASRLKGEWDPFKRAARTGGPAGAVPIAVAAVPMALPPAPGPGPGRLPWRDPAPPPRKLWSDWNEDADE